MALPRFRCAQEYAFIPGPPGVGMQRVSLNQEFDYDERFTIVRRGEEIQIPPGPWMDPVNDEARALVETLVKAKKRKSVAAESAAATIPVTPPRSGISLSLEQQGLHTANVDAPPAPKADRPAPKRRARAS